MSGDSDLPPDLESLDRSLREIRFEPRASLGPELLGRLRRGERSKGAVPPRRFRFAFWGAAASLLVMVGAGFTLLLPRSVVVDRCCYDLDGGGDADDGVIVFAERDARVHRLQLYEDRDRSGHFSPADIVRLDRRGTPAMSAGRADGLITTEHCCLDFDGGGPEDDALLVIGVPPDRVMMAAIYERRPGGPRGNRDPNTFPLR